MSKFESAIDAACALLSSRQHYAKDVLRGYQRWSGADLRGKASNYGGSYARQRNSARTAWMHAGGLIVKAKQTGLLMSAVALCQDDFGNAVYMTHDGIVNANELRA